ncbi:MAG: hypothetical protein MZV70_05200 [Desulfobacterales bacterium]|nr:hypothetical protein [Desulfobacterales bacterium]
MTKKVGVYICQCGTNIAGKVDVQKIAEEIGAEEGCVAVCRTYKYMCSEPGQKLIRDDIEQLHLDHVVEASCTPKMHEPTFRNACTAAGMNPYIVRNGQHPRALLVGLRGRRRRHPQGEGPGARRRRAGGAPSAPAGKPQAGEPDGPGGRRRDRRHHRRAQDRQGRL